MRSVSRLTISIRPDCPTNTNAFGDPSTTRAKLSSARRFSWDRISAPGRPRRIRQGCSTLWNREDFKQVIDARESGAVAVLAEGAGLV
jgi:hypothetical protein